jgi:hypothetical protein
MDVIYICESCGHAKKPTVLQRIFNMLAMVIIIVLLMYFILGMILFGPKRFFELHTTVLLNYKAYGSDDSVRAFAINITKDKDYSCGSDDECRVVAAYNYFVINQLDYAYPAMGKIVYNPEYTINTMSGDCKSLSTMFVNVMSNLGILGRVDCNLDHEHCVAYIYPRETSYYIVVDLTGPAYNRLDKSIDYWKWIDEMER